MSDWKQEIVEAVQAQKIVSEAESVEDAIRKLHYAGLVGFAWGLAQDTYGPLTYQEFLKQYVWKN